jgi:hypothetical protein
LTDLEPIGYAVVLARTLGKEVLVGMSIIMEGVEQIFDVVE